EENLIIPENDRIIAVEYLPGQYDQRADSAAQCIQMIIHGERPDIRVAKIIILSGDISDEEYEKIKNLVINPVETRFASLDKPKTLKEEYPVPEDVKKVEGFTEMQPDQVKSLHGEMSFAMSLDDLLFCQEYFRDVEKRDPTVTELRMIDTYWSDHCRHTTFLTRIEDVDFGDDPVSARIRDVYGKYLDVRKKIYADKSKDICLMDIATLAMKYLKSTGDLDNLDESEEINACSIVVNAIIDGRAEEWLVMFKNETHNHPTEIEPFGGAATCLGGAIRDPLSGRSYVYQAMRVTGSGDPRTPLSETLPGKLPQRVITTRAAHGYSSYGNQIGLATGMVAEIYHDDYVAKRMEIGAVVGAAPRSSVIRKTPEPGDIVILLGGRTGRDGCGGATGSSKEHTEESLYKCGAEVQKGNPPTERKIQRLFRKPAVARMIKKCNDFGAGGVSVAIGELADGLDINLDAIPKKYEGLDGTELAISESQERMAVVVSPENVNRFIEEARKENLEATMVAVVNDTGRLKMSWRGKTIVDLSRDFLDTNGVRQNISVKVRGADISGSVLGKLPAEIEELRDKPLEAWKRNLQRLNVCSQKGLVERFDSTIGGGTVQMPFGGKHQLTPAEGMIAKLPVENGNTTTGTIMTYGYNPDISKWSPFHGAVYAIVESLARLVAMGGNYKKARLTLQEYFEKLGADPEKWGKPFSALMGAFHTQYSLKVPAIGGKDSMSGTFKDMNVPPTLVSFALVPTDVTIAVSPEFK
ncbi:MAG TPA: phosphoribosylformylglycinamidine synthase, partial [Clostridiaceae bacterium]|nr:phosphoribosylformylglycinamidine synthase [Clostridiaceae bacterium]